MRNVSICILLACCSSGHAQSDDGPETMYTVLEETAVRSGPGSDYYATSLLPAGHAVEVYRHQGDWCAIRPPEGSFCWVPTDALAIERGSDVAYATHEVRTRVGSAMSDDRNVAYVTLHQGESVRLLEPTRDGAEEFWCKIEPPAGEFRWIHREELTDEVPDQTDPAWTDEDDRAWQPPERSLSPHQPESTPSIRESLSAIRETMQAILPEMVDEPADTSHVALASGDEPVVMDLPNDPHRSLSTDPPLSNAPIDPGLLPFPTPPATSSPTSAFRLSTELTRIAADLAGELSRHPSTWDLGALRRRTQTVIDVSDTGEVREQGTSLLARIAQFEDIQRRHRLIDREAGGQSLLATNPTMDTSRRPGDSFLPAAAQGSDYDGHGWLMPVVSQNRRVPRYVLTDHQGNILQFVTPSPGINLSRYENQKVGIYGTRGFLPSMKQPHLVAERIVTLDAVR